MEAISQRVLNTQHVNGVKQFLEDICDTGSKSNNLDNTRCVRKRGLFLESMQAIYFAHWSVSTT